MSAQNVQSLPVGERAALMALARQLLDQLSNPSSARELALALMRRLEEGAEDTAKDVG